MYKGTDHVNFTNIGSWIWGGVMVLILFNMAALIFFTSLCIDVTATLGTDKIKWLDTDKCKSGNLTLAIFLAAKEFSALIGIAIGFASIAWVNFFTKGATVAATANTPPPVNIYLSKEEMQKLLSSLPASEEENSRLPKS